MQSRKASMKTNSQEKFNCRDYEEEKKAEVEQKNVRNEKTTQG
jgi:hypothetical protein